MNNVESSEYLPIRELAVSQEEVEGVLVSQKFLQALAIATDETKTSGRETKFSVDLTEDKKPFIHSVVGGGLDTVSYKEGIVEIIAEIDGEDIANYDTARLLDFHFHPSATDAIDPSPRDLEQFVNPRPESSKIEAIGRVNNSDIDVLLVIPRQDGIVQDDLDEYSTFLEEIGITYKASQYDIQEQLSKAGLYTQLISYTYRNKRCYPKNVTFINREVFPRIKVGLSTLHSTKNDSDN